MRPMLLLLVLGCGGPPAADYNRSLGVRQGVRIRLLPAPAPGYAGLSARLMF